jgi:hypothetical protein
MLRGVQWYFYGVPVANPGSEELRVGFPTFSGKPWVCSKEEIKVISRRETSH